ncbi:MAG: phage tail protein [Solirubrobacterales bacterium]
MADPYVAEIRVFGFNFAPKGWAFCDGQLLPISQNTALFSLLGTNFGGDGKSTFGLPNFQGSAAIGQGEGSGLSPYYVGEEGGVPYVTLLQSEIPTHTHTAQASNEPAELQAPNPERALARSKPGFAYQSESSKNLVQMNFQSTTIVGSSLPHNNMPPYLTLNFCIALQGVYPPRE